MPLFSIVIPTRNRAELLCYAIQGALEQDFDDFEVVVSDNDSSDNTRQVVADLNHRRMRYINTGKYLNVADSWDFAVHQAKGKYVSMLSDDDCMSPGLLSILASDAQRGEVNLLSFDVGRYYHPDYFKPEFRNQLIITPFSGDTLRRNALDELKLWHRFQTPYLPPPAAMLSRRVIDIVTAQAGRFFFNPCPDYTAFAMTLSFGGDFIHIDRPLLAFGRSTKSTGETAFGQSNWSSKTNSFEKRNRPRTDELPDNPFVFAPLRAYYWVNAFAESLLVARQALPENFASVEGLSWARYYVRYYREMRDQAAIGMDIKSEREEFWKVVSGLSDDLCAEVKKALRLNVIAFVGQEWPWLTRTARSIIDSSSLLTKMEGLVRPSMKMQEKPRPPIVIHGEKTGFSNILECARQLETIGSSVESGMPFVLSSDL